MSTDKNEDLGTGGDQEGAGRGTGGTASAPQATVRTFPTGVRLLYTNCEKRQRGLARHQERVRIGCPLHQYISHYMTRYDTTQ